MRSSIYFTYVFATSVWVCLSELPDHLNTISGPCFQGRILQLLALCAAFLTPGLLAMQPICPQPGSRASRLKAFCPPTMWGPWMLEDPGGDHEKMAKMAFTLGSSWHIWHGDELCGIRNEWTLAHQVCMIAISLTPCAWNEMAERGR